MFVESDQKQAGMGLRWCNLYGVVAVCIALHERQEVVREVAQTTGLEPQQLARAHQPCRRCM